MANKDNEEKFDAAMDEGVELDEEQLDKIAGGVRSKAQQRASRKRRKEAWRKEHGVTEWQEEPEEPEELQEY